MAISKPVLLFCVTTFFFWAALYLYVPIFPVYAKSIGASLSMVGAIVAAYSIPQLLLRIPIGVLFDAVSRRKPLLAAGIIAASLGALGLGLSPSPWLLFLSRIITGIAGATWVIFAVYFTSFYSRERVAGAISVINFVQGTALVVATYAGGLVAQSYGYSHTFFGAALLGILAIIALLLSREPVTTKTKSVSWRHFTQVASRPMLLIVSLMGILSQFGNWAGLFGFVPIYAAQIGASSADLGMITTLALASSAITSLGAASVAKHRGDSFTIALGAVLSGGTLVVIPFISEVSLLKADMLVNGIGRGLLSTILMSLSIQAVSPQQRATAMGVYQASYAVGMLLGPLVSGYLADSQGLASVFYLAAALYLILVGMAYLPAMRRTTTIPQED